MAPMATSNKREELDARLPPELKTPQLGFSHVVTRRHRHIHRCSRNADDETLKPIPRRIKNVAIQEER